MILTRARAFNGLRLESEKRKDNLHVMAGRGMKECLDREQEALARSVGIAFEIAGAVQPDARANHGDALFFHFAKVALPEPSVAADTAADEEAGAEGIGREVVGADGQVGFPGQAEVVAAGLECLAGMQQFFVADPEAGGVAVVLLAVGAEVGSPYGVQTGLGQRGGECERLMKRPPL